MNAELESAIAERLGERRKVAQDMLAMCDRVAPVLARLTARLVNACLVRDSDVLVYGLDREATLEFIRLAKAGEWRKSVNPSYPTALDYTTSIDGVEWQIYAAPPPLSCRIVETEVTIPEHTEKKRTLICNHEEAA